MSDLVTRAAALAAEMATAHEATIRDGNTTDDERKAHEATMRALDKAAMELAGGNLPRQAGPFYMVASRTQAGVVYRVDLNANTCTCKNGRACWHIAAAQVFDSATKGAMVIEPTPVPTPEPTPDELFDALIDPDEWRSVNDVEADEEQAYHSILAAVTDDMVIEPPSDTFDNPDNWPDPLPSGWVRIDGHAIPF